MASREGARAGGTDGSDFGHRETVASHYQIRCSYYFFLYNTFSHKCINILLIFFTYNICI